MMDIEKLIEQLRYLADTPSYTAFHDAKEREIICDQCEADFCYDKQQDAHWCMYEALSRAATALSTLKAENEKLRAELESVKRERDAAIKDIWVPKWISCKNGENCSFVSAITGMPDCAGCDNWEWRGQKKN